MRGLLLTCCLAMACSEVTVVPDDGEGGSVTAIAVGISGGGGADSGVGAGTAGVGGSTTGVGGGGGDESRLIEIALAGPTGGPVDGVVVLVNGVYGELRASYSGSELPVMAEVVDGDLVSFYIPDDEPGIVLRSYRVRPAVWRIAEIGPASPTPCEDLAPMSVTIDVPAVESGVQYVVSWAGHNAWVAPGLQTIDVAACSSEAPLEMLLYASGGSSEPVAYGLAALGYVPGGAAVLAFNLVTSLQNVEVVTGAAEPDVYVNGWWQTDQGVLVLGPQPPWESTGTGYAANLIAPGGGFAWVNALWTNDVTVEGWCTSSANQQRVPSAAGAVVLDGSPPDLAQPITLGDGMFALADDGPRGDLLWQSFRVDPAAPYNWLVYDDPWAVETPLVFPELPPGDPWGLEPSSLPFAAMGHENSDAIHGYADSVAKLVSPAFSPTRSRYLHSCD